MDLRGYNSRTEWELLQGWQGFSALARGPQVFLHLEVEPATPQSTPRLPTARPCQLITPLLAPCKKEAMSSAAAQLVAYARPLLRQDGRDQEAVDSRRLRHGAGGRQAGRGAAPRQLGGRKGQRYSGGGENWPGPRRWWRGIGVVCLWPWLASLARTRRPLWPNWHSCKRGQARFSQVLRHEQGQLYWAGFSTESMPSARVCLQTC